MTAAQFPNPYLKTKVMTAGPAELRLMLFDGAIKFAEQGKAGLVAKDFEAAYTGISRCQKIIIELINALRPEENPELCDRLSALYMFMYSRLVAASSERNTEHVDEVLNLLHYERQTWQMLLEKMAEENASAVGMSETPGVAPPNPRNLRDPRNSRSPLNLLDAGEKQASPRQSDIVGGQFSLEG